MENRLLTVYNESWWRFIAKVQIGAEIILWNVTAQASIIYSIYMSK